MNIADIKLKPCPFCGREPVYRVMDRRPGHIDPQKIKVVWEIGCSGDCFANISSTKWHHYSDEIDQDANVFDHIPEWMIDMWNQRA